MTPRLRRLIASGAMHQPRHDPSADPFAPPRPPQTLPLTLHFGEVTVEEYRAVMAIPPAERLRRILEESED